MPGYDGTGPFGDGRPGRGLGRCARNHRRFRNRDYSYQELQNQKKQLERELEEIKIKLTKELSNC